jgi:MoaA/NifB/PqqE/SkfB family radical SAM enzyme
MSEIGLDAGTGVGPVPTPVLQIHASLRCNLACAHCYSLSSPSATGVLALERVCQAIDDAAGMGYQAVAFSGGEPLSYRGLTEALRRAKSLGLRTSVTTNGTLLSPRRLEALHELVDLVAVSLDGPPEIHNEVRGSPSAFERMAAGVENLRSAGFRFGFIHTLTRESWEHLPWLADFARRNGAALFQIHPLEIFGRAVGAMRAQRTDDEVLARAYLLSFALVAKYEGSMGVQIDLVHRDQVLRDPACLYGAERFDSGASAAQLLGVVVLEPDGSMVPVAYGFSRHFMICNINRERFATAWPRYAATVYTEFRRLCRAALDGISSCDTPQLFNWHELIVNESLARRSLS